jgi:hypothetical protein
MECLTILGLRRLAAAAALSVGIAVSLAVSASPVAAQGATIGQVKTVSGQSFIVRGGARLPATAGDLVVEKDVIETGGDGSIGITFVDNTVFSAGPNSQVALEEFRFDSSEFQGAMVASVSRGTLSVVSGDIARTSPGAMRVRTPTTVLGVRGTRFLVRVGDDR